MDEFPVHWETVFADPDVSLATYRLRVPGGWLIIVRDSLNTTTHPNFVADPQGSWKLES